jgi:glucosyl-dolichyl phosphate glucuronosyltransferase
MSGHLPFVSIIIPTYNRHELLTSAIDSFLKLHYPKDLFEIIICDNNSKDATRKVISEWQVKATIPIVYLFERRLGVHFARNSAAKIARGQILYFTDDDMIADPMLLDELVKVFDLDPKIGCATGKILPRFQMEPPKWVSKYLINAHLSLTPPGLTEELKISQDSMVYSCHQAIRREVFYRAGGFNPENVGEHYVGDGETGLNIKIAKLGYYFGYTAKSLIYHIIPPHRMTYRYLINSFGTSGYCVSFTDYRSHRRKELILPRMLRRNTIGIIMLFAKAIVKVLIGREPLRFLPAYLVYLHKRNRFDLKLYRDSKYRRLVEIDDWLNAEEDDYLGAIQSLV